MSKRFTDLVFSGAPVKGQRLLLLLALADWADDDGEFVPGHFDHVELDSLARQARMSPRRARQLFGEFMDGDLVYCTANGGDPYAGWRLNAEAFRG